MKSKMNKLKPIKKFSWKYYAFIGLFLVSLNFIFSKHGTADTHNSESSFPRFRIAQISPPKSLDDLPEIPINLISLEMHPIMYCYVPKANCRSMKRLLRKQEGFSDWKDTSKIHVNNGLKMLASDRSFNESVKLLRDEKIFKFVIVRDPYARLISAYENKIWSRSPEQQVKYREILVKECPQHITVDQTSFESELSFSQFVRCVTSVEKSDFNDMHWRSQSRLCGLEYIKYDKVLTIESFPEDVMELLNRLGWRKDRRIFKLWRKPVLELRTAKYFNDEDVKLVQKHYKEDFEILGYPTNPTGMIGFYSNVEHLIARYGIAK